MKYFISSDDLISLCEFIGCSIQDGRKTLDEMEPAVRRRILFSLKEQYIDDGLFLVDPIERDPVFSKLIDQAKRRAESETPFDGIGHCYLIWSRQAEILQNEHGIDWYSPAEMNPWIRFD